MDTDDHIICIGKAPRRMQALAHRSDADSVDAGEPVQAEARGRSGN